MGKKRNKEEVELLIETCKRADVRLIYNEEINQIFPRTNIIWKNLSEQLNAKGVKISSLGIFTAVSKNYYNLWKVLNIHKKFVSSPHISHFSSESSSDSSDFDNLSSSDEGAMFQFCFKTDEFENLKQDIVIYKRTDISKNKSRHKTFTREYNIFEKYTWPSLIRKKIFDTTSLNCCFLFKRAKIHPTSSHPIKISGRCKECLAVLNISTNQNTIEDDSIIFNCVLSGKYHEKHQRKFKLPVKGNERQEIIKKMVSEHKSASSIRNEMARKYMKEGDKEPDFIPKLTTLRAAKSLYLKSKRIDNDPIVSLYKTKSWQEYGNIIHNIGYSPFFVYFWSNSQIMVYRRYCKATYCRISIDATGGVVKKITYPDGLKSQNIYLYEIVVNYKGQYSVGSMLSESHSAYSIQSWLKSWLQSAVHSPSEIVTDMSLALIYACVPVFTEFRSLAEYLDRCYQILFEQEKRPPKVFLRNDVAHIIKLFSTWTCLKNQHRITKTFYMRVLGQIIQCQDTEDLKNLLEALFTVAYSDTEGINEMSLPTICETRKKWLIRRIATGTTELMLEEARYEDTHEIPYNKNLEQTPSNNLFRIWAQSIADEVEKLVNKPGQIGDRGNQQVLPAIVKEILKLSNTFPMWTSVLCQFFPMSKRISSSAASESNFNNIKNRMLSDKQLPLRVDNFVLSYVDNLVGHVNIVAANLEHQEDLDVNEVSIIEKSVQNKIDDTVSGLAKIIGQKESSDSEIDMETAGSKKIHKTLQGEITGQSNKQRSHLTGSALRSNICSSCQLTTTDTTDNFVSCSMCNISLHSNDNCAIKYENLTLCKPCFNRGIEDRSVVEEQAKEHWMRCNVPPKKRPRTSYLEPDSETLFTDFKKTHRSTAIGLLRNGNLVHTNPLKIGNNYVTLKNTCGTDSLTQLLCVAYCDSDKFKTIIDEIQDNILCELVKKMINSGVTAAYHLRGKLLFNTFPHIVLPNDITCVLGESTICESITKTFDSMYIGHEISLCLSCRNEMIKNIYFITLELDNASKIDLSEIYPHNANKNCAKCIMGRMDTQIKLNNNFLFIEPINITHHSLMIETTLDSIQKYIHHEETVFILRGIVAFQGIPDPQHLGHFIALGYRHNDKWVLYNDLLKKPKTVPPSTSVSCVLLFYSV